eukprot:1620090-Rhodomonas_salina.1
MVLCGVRYCAGAYGATRYAVLMQRKVLRAKRHCSIGCYAVRGTETAYGADESATPCPVLRCVWCYAQPTGGATGRGAGYGSRD